MKAGSSLGGYERMAYLYDAFDQKDNIEFFFHYASKAGDVLDVGAGTGRIAMPLAARGVTMCCIEPSPAMRRSFEMKLAQRPDLSAKIQLVAGAAHSFTIDRTFPLAFLSGVFDHFLDDQERRQSLVNIGRHLELGGVLVLDVFLGLMEDAPLSPAGRVEIEGKDCRRFVGGKLLPGNKKETILVFEVYEGGELLERIEERSLVGVTHRQGVHHVLKESGFSIVQEWSTYDFTPYRDGDPLLILEVVKDR